MLLVADVIGPSSPHVLAGGPSSPGVTDPDSVAADFVAPVVASGTGSVAPAGAGAGAGGRPGGPEPSALQPVYG